MAKFIRKSVDATIEHNITTAAIISTYFIEQIYPLYNPQYMKNTYARIVVGWVIDYFDKFGESPRHVIQSIFDIEKGKLDDAEIEIIAEFLKTLNKNYVEDQGINEEYVLQQAIDYFRVREVSIRVENAQKLLDVGKVDKAEEELFKMKKVVRLATNWSNPLEAEKITHLFDETNNHIFKLPGVLGELLGNLERGWLIAVFAPFKRGKTWFLLELCILAALSGLKVVFISLEMKEKNINERIYKRITAYGKEGKTHHVIPVFDCVKNQTDTCVKGIRTNFIGLIEGANDEPPEFDPAMDYRACDVCRNNQKEKADYETATWFEQIEKPEFTHKNVSKRIKQFRKYHGDNIRTKSYPRFSAGIKDFERDLDILEQTEGFIPDLIAVDYAGIIKPESNSGDTKAIDDVWKGLAAMVSRRNALGATGSQGNRGGIYKENMDQTDLAEWIGQLGHIDKMVAVNQTHKEKKRGLVRMGMLADRHEEFHEKDQVVVLQSLALGQVHLDSEML